VEHRIGVMRRDARCEQVGPERRRGGPDVASASHEAGDDRDVYAVGVHLLVPGDLVEKRLEGTALVAAAAQVGRGDGPPNDEGKATIRRGCREARAADGRPPGWRSLQAPPPPIRSVSRRARPRASSTGPRRRSSRKRIAWDSRERRVASAVKAAPQLPALGRNTGGASSASQRSDSAKGGEVSGGDGGWQGCGRREGVPESTVL